MSKTSDIDKNFKVGSIIHPSDVGFFNMAQCVKKAFEEIFKK